MKKITVTSTHKLPIATVKKIIDCIHGYINPPMGNTPNHILIFNNGALSRFHCKMDFSGKHNFKTILQPKGILIEVDCVFDTKQIMDVYRGPGWTQSLVSLNRKKLEVIGAVFVLLDEDAIKKLEAICGSVKIVSAL